MLKFVEIPNFSAIIVRRTTPQLKGPGGIFEKCKRIFSKVYTPGVDYKWMDKEGKFVFIKSGAQIYLRHFENEAAEDNYQGAEANLFVIDEGTQFTMPMIQYLMSRMRNPNCPQVQPHMKITCNPDEGHFLRKWVEPYLQEDGTPDRSKDGMLRYFTFYEGDFCWGDTVEDVMLKTGCDKADVLSFTFISSTVLDNPVVQKVNPKYVSWLKGLKGVLRKRLLEGNWYAREEGSSYWSRSWVTELTEPPDPSEIVKIVRAFDWAGKLPDEQNRSPDYTASVKMAKLKNGNFVVLDITRHRMRFGDWFNHAVELAKEDGKSCSIILPIDPNPHAKASTMMLARDLNAAGYTTYTKRSSQGKLDAFRPFAASCQVGVVDFVKDCGRDFWNNVYNTNEFAYTELEMFTGKRKKGELGHDDKR